MITKAQFCTNAIKSCFRVAVMISAFVWCSQIAKSAEVKCQLQFKSAFPSDEANRRWPSGRRPKGNNCSAALIEGAIVTGDYERFKSFYEQHHPFLSSVYLNSPGGNALEAIKIGSHLRKHLIQTESPSLLIGRHYLSGVCDGKNCTCASACSLIWFGAPLRSGRVGLHRPFINSQEFNALPAAQAASAYNATLKKISAYLQLMNAPPSVIETMTTTSSADITWVDDGVLEGVRIDRDPGIGEWLDANCGKLPTQELQAMHTLQAESYVRALHSAEQNRLGAIQKKYQNKVRCEMLRMSRSRDAL